jgi:hypothetical protein
MPDIQLSYVMNDLELELQILKKYANHYDSVTNHASKCDLELDLKTVISKIIGQPGGDSLLTRWHSKLARTNLHKSGTLKPCSDTKVNRGAHRYHLRAFIEAGHDPAWERIAELERLVLPQRETRPQSDNQAAPCFVAMERIDGLRALESSNFDLRKLIRLCEELNISHANRALYAITMLVRAVLDHVPPLFGKKSFAEVASNYRGGRSFKDPMERLEKTARKIADKQIHGPICHKEVLPTLQQVSFTAEVDLLLAEIIHIVSRIKKNALSD